MSITVSNLSLSLFGLGILLQEKENGGKKGGNQKEGGNGKRGKEVPDVGEYGDFADPKKGNGDRGSRPMPREERGRGKFSKN